MGNALVPELSVRDWQASLAFYRDLIGFEIVYSRPEEGFAYLALGAAELMIDQIGVGRDFEADLRTARLGAGLNLQIRVPSVAPLTEALTGAEVPLHLPVEERWYRRGSGAVGLRQFVVADPDGYLLRLYEELGTRTDAA